MNNFQKILVVIDGEFLQSGHGIPIELEKAKRLVSNKDSVHLHLFCGAFQPYLQPDTLSLDLDQKSRREEYCAQLKEGLDRLGSALMESGIHADNSVAWAYPRYQTVVEKAGEIQADLVVQHTRTYGKLEFNHLTNDAWQMIRHCPVPLLLVKDRPWQEPLMVLATVDPMHSHHKPAQLDHRIMDAAFQLKEQTSADLHVLHAYAEAARPFAPAGVIQSEHRQALDEFLSAYAMEGAKLHFEDETAIAAIEEKVNQLNIDVVVMGAISRSRVYEALIGSTAEKLLDFLQTDVMVIRPQQAEQD